MAWHRHTSLTNFTIQQSRSFESVSVPLRLHELFVPRTRLSTYGDRAFPVAAVPIWNSLLQHITSAPSLSVFCSRLKTILLRTLLHVITVVVPTVIYGRVKYRSYLLT